MDRVGPLNSQPITGRLESSLEGALADPGALRSTVRALVDAEFPPTLATDVLMAVGFDPEEIYSESGAMSAGRGTDVAKKRRSSSWPAQVMQAWDRQCAFSGYDGQLGSGSVALEAAHVRWFNYEGPDDLDNGLALCSLHHKLFDRGALGLTDDCRIRVSSNYTARTEAGRRVYDLADLPLRARPGTLMPATQHLAWHSTQVFKGTELSA